MKSMKKPRYKVTEIGFATYYSNRLLKENDDVDEKQRG